MRGVVAWAWMLAGSSRLHVLLQPAMALSPAAAAMCRTCACTAPRGGSTDSAAASRLPRSGDVDRKARTREKDTASRKGEEKTKIIPMPSAAKEGGSSSSAAASRTRASEGERGKMGRRIRFSANVRGTARSKKWRTAEAVAGEAALALDISGWGSL